MPYRQSVCRLLLGFALLAPAALSPPCPAADVPATGPTTAPTTAPSAADRAKIEAAVLRLGSPSAAAREAAVRVLWSYGRAAEPVLEEAAKVGDPEISSRARSVLRDLRLGVGPDAPADVVEAVRQYAEGDVEKRRRVLDTLADAGNHGRGPLLRLYVTETDAKARQEVFKRLTRNGIGPAARAALAAGEAGVAEALLLEAIGPTGGGSGDADYAAFLVERGGVDQKIAQLESDLPTSDIDRRRDTLLAYLYRAKGDLPAARKAADRSGDKYLAATVAFLAGDWRPTADQYWATAGRGTSADNVNLALAFQHLARDDAKLKAAADNAREYVFGHPDEAWYTIKALLLTDLRDEAVALARKHGNYRQAFEILRAQGRFADALELVDAAAKAGEAKNTVPAREQAVAVRVDAAGLLWQLGEADKAHAMADAAGGAADALREFAKKQAEAAAAAAAKGEGPVPARVRPSAWVWHGLAGLERRVGRQDRADRIALAAVAEEEDEAGLRPGKPGPAGKDFGGDALEGLFPDRGRLAALWWQVFREKFADDAPPARLARVRAVLDGKADAKDVVAWAADVRAALGTGGGGTTNSYWVSSRLQLLADTLYAYGKTAEAEAALDRAALAWPAGDALSTAADAALDRGDWERAADYYRRAATLHDASAVFVYLRGVALRNAGRAADGDAAVALSKVLPLGDADQRLRLSDAMAKHGDPAGAREQEDLALRTGRLDDAEGANALRRWANREAQAGHFPAAADALEVSLLPVFRTNSSFLETGPYLQIPAVTHVWRSRGAIQSGDLPAAVRAAEAAQDAVPENVEITIELVNALDEKGAKKEADALFARAWAWHGKVHGQFPRYGQGYNAAAWLAGKCGRELGAGLEMANKAVASAPNNTAFIDTLAEVLFRMGRRDEAAAQMKRCLEIEPKSAYFQEQMKRFTAPATRPAGGGPG